MKCIVLLLALFITLGVGAQTDEEQLYKHKIAQYSKTKTAGGILLSSGIILSTVGIAALVVNQNEVNTNWEEDNSFDETLAVYAIGFGIDMIIGGIILQTVGNRKVKQYQEKYRRLQSGISVLPNSTGFSLVYRF